MNKLAQDLIKSSIANRVSPSTISEVCRNIQDKDQIIKFLINYLSSIFPTISIKEFKEISTDLNNFIGEKKKVKKEVIENTITINKSE